MIRRQFLRFLAGSPLFRLAGQEHPVITDPSQALSVFDFEPAAKKAIPPAHFGYIATGVDDDRTLRENHEAYSRIQLRPRRLVDVSRVDMSVELFGTKWPTPLFLCPCSAQKAYHSEGELATARAGNTRKTLMLLSTVATTSVEDAAAAAGRPIWQQLYPTNRWEVTEKIVHRAEAAGCPVLVVTVDISAGRNTETAERYKALDTRKCSACHPTRVFSGRKPSFDGVDTEGLRVYNPALTWDSVRRIRGITRMKVLLKGIVTAEDAKLAVEYGVDGLVVRRAAVPPSTVSQRWSKRFAVPCPS